MMYNSVSSYIITKHTEIKGKDMETAFRKAAASSLAAAIIISVLCSCGESAGAPVSGAETQAQTAAVTETEAETTKEILKDNVPELDFGGVSFNMAGQGTQGGNNDLDMYISELTGDVVRDAIYERNRAIEERFNVVISEPLMTDYTNISSTIKKMVSAGDSTYDLVVNQLAQTSSDVLNGYAMNLNEIPYLDFSQKWYPASVMESASLNGKLYLMVSDMCLSYIQQTWSMCFNKDLTTNMGIDGLYDLARNGEWTIDKLHEITKDIYIDVNGDGQKDEGDTYGFTMGKSGIDGCMGAAFIYGAGLRFLDINDDFTINNLLGSERAQTVADRFHELNTQPGSTAYTKENYTIFAMMNHVAVFAPAQLGHYYQNARDFEGLFGVLPMPKLEAAQESYATLCDAGCNCISVPITCRDPELTGAMIEAMSSYSKNYILPAYVDIALQTKVARDEESVEMMQLVLDSRVMDFGYLYCGWNGWTWKLNAMFKDPGNYMSTFEKSEKSETKAYDKIIAMFID